MKSIGGVLDGLACRISGHIWIQRTEIEGVMMCTRCQQTVGRQLRRRRPRRRRTGATESLVPEHRPWLEPPFTASQFDQ